MTEYELKKFMSPADLATALGLQEGTSPQGLYTNLDYEDGRRAGFTHADKFVVLTEDEPSAALVEKISDIAVSYVMR